MTNLILPISSPVRLDILAMPVGEFVDEHISPSPLRTRLKGRLKACDQLRFPVWYYLTNDKNFIALWAPGVGSKSLELMDGAMGVFNGEIGMFRELRWALHEIDRQNRFEGPSIQVLMGTDDWLPNWRTINRLVGRGLRKAMPIGELFVYAPLGSGN